MRWSKCVPGTSSRVATHQFLMSYPKSRAFVDTVLLYSRNQVELVRFEVTLAKKLRTKAKEYFTALFLEGESVCSTNMRSIEKSEVKQFLVSC